MISLYNSGARKLVANLADSLEPQEGPGSTMQTHHYYS